MGHLSNLLRLTLELSKKEAVTLAEEIDYLKSYIELQSLRLNKTLDYCFDTSIDLKLSEIFIPPADPTHSRECHSPRHYSIPIQRYIGGRSQRNRSRGLHYRGG